MFYICICHSCVQPTKVTNTIDANTIEPIIIDVDQALTNQTKFHFSDFVDSISYVPIKTDQDNFISSPIQPIGMTSNYIILYDGLSRLYCYDKNKQSIRRIANRGKGPGEYNGIQEFVADEQNKIVYALTGSASVNTIFKYNFQGEFLGKILLDENADDIGLTEEGFLVIHYTNWTGKTQKQYSIIDNNGKLLNCYHNPFPYHLSGQRSVRLFDSNKYQYKNKLHMKDRSDTLYVFEGTQRHPKYIFKNSSSIDKKQNLTSTEYDESLNFWYIFESDSRLQFAFPYQNKIHHCYYDKISGKTFSTNVRDVPNDVDDHYPYSSRLDRQFNDYVIKIRWGIDGQLVENKDEEMLFLVLLHLK